MCDYSLGLAKSRPAQIGDKLVLTPFASTCTRGFASIAERDVAVCLMPGTEVAFEKKVFYFPALMLVWRTSSRLARFRQIRIDNPNVHHDALEFSDGKIISLQDIVIDQKMTVLQLPTIATPRAPHSEERLMPSQSAPSLTPAV